MAAAATAPNARGAAVALLGGVLGEGAMLTELLADPDGPLKSLPPQERARAQRLATGVLRRLGPIDRILAPLLRKAPPLAVLNILRLAVHEIATGAARHGVVHSAVDLTRAGPRTQALVASFPNCGLSAPA